MSGPEPIQGAPQATVWFIGALFILLALGLIAAIVAMAVSIYHDARERGAPALAWCLATLIGGWLTAVVWMVVRDRYDGPD